MKCYPRIALMIAGLLLATIAIVVTPQASPEAQAISGTDFDPGNIISDQRFFDANAMSASDIQYFLASKEPSCSASGLPCLKNYWGITVTQLPSQNGCTGYNSVGYETGATIIWRVAQACSINPQVILSTLEKEQGLVSDPSPTVSQYNAAMGYGCPAAGCDGTTNTFFLQVYRAAWQFRQYAVNPNAWHHHVGFVSVRFHPNALCGASTVFIQNQATADLYNYTPYQPDAAALANLHGTGDSCSAYGNRNFWLYFNTWFGPSTSPGPNAIAKEYAYQGGSSGPLGPPISGFITIPDHGGGIAQAYTAGSIYWTAAAGAYAVYGPIRDYYFTVGGASGDLQWPISRLGAIAQNGGGFGQMFQTASVYSSTAGTFRVSGFVRERYFANGGAAGLLGFPTAEQTCVITAGAICTQAFSYGLIVGPKSGDAHAVRGSILTAFNANGGAAGVFGLPTTDPIVSTVNGGGIAQVFAGGSVYAYEDENAYLVRGTIRDFYFAHGGSDGILGWPTGQSSCTSSTDCIQTFQYGTVTSTSRGTSWQPSALAAAVAAAGGVATLGAANSDVVSVPESGGGIGQSFTRGSVYVSTRGGFAVLDPIRNAYFAQGGAAGRLGFPSGAQSCSPGGACSQSFGGGTIYSSSSTGAHSLVGSIASAYLPISALLGLPTSDEISIPQNGGGVGQAFQNGSMYQRLGGNVFAVSGDIRSVYFSKGGAAGSYGWPTSTELSMSGGSAQAFDSGSIYKSTSGTFATDGAIRDAYWATGGSMGTLGWPTSTISCGTSSCLQTFQFGSISWSPALGITVRRS